MADAPSAVAAAAHRDKRGHYLPWSSWAGPIKIKPACRSFAWAPCERRAAWSAGRRAGDMSGGQAGSSPLPHASSWAPVGAGCNRGYPRMPPRPPPPSACRLVAPLQQLGSSSNRAPCASRPSAGHRLSAWPPSRHGATPWAAAFQSARPRRLARLWLSPALGAGWAARLPMPAVPTSCVSLAPARPDPQLSTA